MLRISGGISDENFNGSRVRDTEDKNRFSKEGADFLKDALAKAIQPTKNLSATNKEKISQVSSKITQALADNTEAVQKIMSEQDDTRKEFLKLISMMTDAQKKTGESSQVAMKEIIKQIERVKLTDGEGTKDVAKILGLDAAQKEIAKPLGRQTMTGALVEKLTNVDIRKESITKAFTLEKMFGLKPGSDDILKSAQDEVAAGKINTEAAEAKAAVAEATLGDTSTVTEKVEKLKESKEKESKEKEINTTTVPVVTTNSQGGQAFATGTDRISPAFQQVDLLEQILQQLKDIKDENPSRTGVISPILIGAIVRALPAILTALTVGAGLLALKAIINALIDSNYVETTAEPILESREDMYKAGIGMSDEDQARRKEFANQPIERAKNSGLYDKDYAGNSEVDLDVLASTTDPSMLQAILDDDDISDLDRMRVEKRINQLNTEGDLGPVRPSIIPASAPPGIETAPTATPETATPEINPIDGRRSEGEPVTELAPIGSMPLVDSNGNTVPEKVQAGESAKSSTAPIMMNIPAKDVLGFAAEILIQNKMAAAPTIGAGVLSMEAQGLEKVVSPTADAVNNVSDLVENILSSITNNIQNITNNNNTSGGSQAPNVLVNPPTARNMGSSVVQFLINNT